MLRGSVFVATSVYSMARQRHRNAERDGTFEVCGVLGGEFGVKCSHLGA